MDLLVRLYTWLLCLSIVLQCLTVQPQQEKIVYNGSSSYRESVFYDRLTAIEKKDIRSNMINIAKSQIGYMEGQNNKQLNGNTLSSGNYTEYGSWYGMQDAWCAMFVSWCANLAGETNIPKHASCTSGLKALQKQGVAHTRKSVANGEYIPQPGDIIYFATQSSLNKGKLASHVGIVVEYKNGIVYTIEGNTTPNDQTIKSGGIVEEKSYKITNTYIVYICELI